MVSVIPLSSFEHTQTMWLILHTAKVQIISRDPQWCKTWASKPSHFTMAYTGQKKMNQCYCITAAQLPHCEWAHSAAPPQRDLQYSNAKTITHARTHRQAHTGKKEKKENRQSKGWWWLWHIAMPPTVVPVRGQSTSNWASVTHALCQSSSPALACNAWHIAEPPTGLLSSCPADDEVGG